LVDQAIALLKALPTEQGNGFVFIGARKGTPLGEVAMARLIADRDLSNRYHPGEIPWIGLSRYSDSVQMGDGSTEALIVVACTRRSGDIDVAFSPKLRVYLRKRFTRRPFGS
jgi:hypothetical protein